MRRNYFNVAFVKQSMVKFITVVGLVANNSIRSILRKATVDRLFNQFHFLGRSAFNGSGDRKTRSVWALRRLLSYCSDC